MASVSMGIDTDLVLQYLDFAYVSWQMQQQRMTILVNSVLTSTYSQIITALSVHS